MFIYIDTTVPYEFKTKEACYKHVVIRCHNIKKSLRFVEKDIGHLCVRCPISGDYLEIFGEQFEIDWLDKQLRINSWYRVKP